MAERVTQRPTITFRHRGSIERGNGRPGYDWHDGYSEDAPGGGVTYPWMTRKECRAAARAAGARAVFAP